MFNSPSLNSYAPASYRGRGPAKTVPSQQQQQRAATPRCMRLYVYDSRVGLRGRRGERARARGTRDFRTKLRARMHGCTARVYNTYNTVENTRYCRGMSNSFGRFDVKSKCRVGGKKSQKVFRRVIAGASACFMTERCTRTAYPDIAKRTPSAVRFITFCFSLVFYGDASRDVIT